jgi:predicted permease
MLSLFRLALRSFAKAPGFTVIAILTLALGISMSTTAFSLANILVFRPLPFKDSSQLYEIFRTSPQNESPLHSPGNYLDLKANAKSFTSLAAYCFNYSSYVASNQPAQQVLSMDATASLLATLGMQPMLGRGFTPDEDQPGKESVVIITHRLWTHRLGSDPSVIGKTLRINGKNRVVIGVMPANFEVTTLWGPVELIAPMTIWPNFVNERKLKWFNLLGRLAPGIDAKGAQTELDSIARRMDKDYPVENSSDGLRAQDLSSAFIGSLNTQMSYLILGLSCMVLLIACANLASIQIARSFYCARDYAIRSALGAKRWHLMSPLLMESLLLSIAGGPLGLCMASWMTDLLGRSILINDASGLYIPIDGKVLAFSLFASCATVFVSGLIPAWLASKSATSDTLKEGGRSSAGGNAQMRAKYALVIGELALALVLIGVASSFSIALQSFLRRDLGWNTHNLAAGTVSLPYERYDKDEKRMLFFDRLLERIKATPGVEQAAVAFNLPFISYFGSQNIIVDGQSLPIAGQEPLVQTSLVSHDFFAALQIPLSQGTYFPENLKAKDPAVIVINEAMAKRFWPGETAVGKRIRWRDSQEWLEVVGVVGDVRMAIGLTPPSTRFQAYRPMVQTPNSYFDIIIRSNGSPESYVPLMRKAVSELDADLPVANANTVTHQIENSLANLGVIINQLGLFALMGLLISALSVYGVISHITARRTREIGVRIALGANERTIIGMTLKQGLWLLLGGILLGLIGSFILGRILQSMIPEMGMPGVWLQFASALLLGLVTVFACWLPARRASRIDPVVALRAE